MRFHFPIVIIDENFRSENASGLGIRVLAKAIEAEGMEVLGVTSIADFSSFAQQQSRAWLDQHRPKQEKEETAPPRANRPVEGVET